MRAAQQHQQESQREATSAIERAREALKQKRDRARQERESQPSSVCGIANTGTSHVLASFGDLHTINAVGDELQHKLVKTMAHAMKSENHIQCSDTELASVQMTGDFLSMNYKALARTTGEHNIPRRVLAIGQALLEMSYYVWNLLFMMILNMCKSPGDVFSTRPLLTCVRLRYDETPSKVRVDDPSGLAHSDDSHTVETSTSCQHAKVLQIECLVGVLLQDHDLSTGATLHTFISGEIPVPLFALHSTSGENTASALRQVLQSLPMVHETCRDSTFSFRHSSSDAAGANLKAERILSSEFRHMTHIPILCDIHKLHRATRSSMGGADFDVSGLLSFALALSEAGSVQRLHQVLGKIIMKRLVPHPEQ